MTLRIRSYLFVTAFFALTFVYCSICILFFACPKDWVIMVSRWWSAASLFALRIICGTRFAVDGRENIPAGRMVIFVSKHQSAWETVAYQKILGNLVFMFKKELLYIPFFGLMMLKAGNIMVDRGATTRKGLKKLVDKFREVLNYRNIAVFPEGTRVLPGAAPAYKSGLGIIAAALDDATIVPVAINSGLYWPREGFLKYPGTIRVKIMPAFSAAGMDHAAISAKAEEAIENGMKSL
ncbi:MAG: 1-acyl-sn-glycerol-3-phosphate acyltransferase [Rickettsiales bacterium]|jgi:1-acyl-sn-glycerol-3-phosphate acyltransferase|nr:1-acyl-sn-glycerol-3-phosphate acyltransferase [Rickettsiales bacterium]